MGYGPIRLAYNTSGLQVMLSPPEGATQTIKQGNIVKLSAGNVVAGDTADPWTAADVVYGISAEDAHNLAVAGTAETLSIGSPLGQASATITPIGAPIENGKLMVYPANSSNVFQISLKTGQSYSAALVVAGAWYALKWDAATGFYYLDSTDTAGNNTVAELVGPVDGQTTQVLFRFKASQRYFD